MSRKDEQVDEIETRLRSLIGKHSETLLALTADPSVSKRSFVSQIAEQVSSLPSSTNGSVSNDSPAAVGFVKIASIDVSQASVHSTLKAFAQKYPGVSDLIEKCSAADTSQTDDSIIQGENFVADTHITMVHCSQLPQNTIRDQFEPLVGCAVNVEVTGILWNEQIAALAVDIASDTHDAKPVPAPKNSFPHITLWHKPEVSAARSNDLPELVQDGEAERIDFDEPVVIQGFVSLWGEDRG